MKIKSPLANGLLYAGICGGFFSLIPLSIAIFDNQPLGELAMFGGVIILVWGSLGFAAGFSSYRESTSDASGQPVLIHRISGIRHWFYRIVAGFLLSYIATSIVCGLGMAVFYLCDSGWINPANRGISREQMHLLFFIGTCGMIGAQVGAAAGCWLGAILMPGDDKLGNVARGAFVSALLGSLGGCWLGASSVGSLHPRYVDESQAIILAVIAGSVVGIAAAIFVRARVFRTP